MKSIDKLRTSLKDCTKEAGVVDKFDTYWITADACDHLIDEIEAEIADNYMRLPVDANNEPIHVGDKVETFDCPPHDYEKFTVYGFTTTASDGGDWYVIDGYDQQCYSEAVRHVKPRTLENIVADAIQYGHNGITGDRIEGKVAEFCAEIRELLGGDAS